MLIQLNIIYWSKEIIYIKLINLLPVDSSQPKQHFKLGPGRAQLGPIWNAAR